jgi:GTPase SAR1 family protein
MATRPRKNIQNELQILRTFLTQEQLLTFSQEGSDQIREQVDDLLEKINILDKEVLTIGLLGGTGVGKSSLMNALAQKMISTTSHRRPYTDQVIIYRHESIPLPATIQSISVPFLEITHQAETIRHILLCDLPDFDSLLGEHHTLVLDFLSCLDLLIFVTSLEKYGDYRFYEFLQSVPKAHQNCYFVLNKVDKYFSREAANDQKDDLKKITEQFKYYISEALDAKIEPEGIRLFCLAATEAFSTDPLSGWNELDAFRQVVFQHRDEKEVAKIKKDNLDIEVQRLSKLFDQELQQIHTCQETLEILGQELEKERQKWRESAQYLFHLWSKEYLLPLLVYEQADLDALVGPGYLVGIVKQEVNTRKKNAEAISQEKSLVFPEKHASVLRNKIAHLENLLTSQMLRYNLPPKIRETIQQELSPDKIWQELEEEMASTLSLTLYSTPVPKYRLFRCKQWTVYTVLLIIVLCALAGPKAWSDLINAFNLSNSFQWLFSIAHSLFSPIGLAGLVSLAIIALILGIRFSFQHERLIYKRSQTLLAFLNERVAELWEATLDGFIENLRVVREDLTAREDKLSLHQKKAKPTSS